MALGLMGLILLLITAWLRDFLSPGSSLPTMADVENTVESTVRLVIVAVLFCVVVAVTVFSLKTYWASAIKSKSLLYIEMEKLNEQCRGWFINLNTHERFLCSCKSLQEFRKKNNTEFAIAFLCGAVQEHTVNWTDVARALERNRYGFEQYKRLCADLDYRYGNKGVFLGSAKRFRNYEMAACMNIYLRPVTQFDFILRLQYMSPAGQSFNVNEFTFPIATILATVAADIKMRQSREYQRSLMTDKKRYEILKRDEFKCAFCGRTPAADGVALEVDHIIPVSKGGLSEDSNLQTLCKDCNRGKGTDITNE